MSELYLKDRKVMTLSDRGGVPAGIRTIDAPELLPVILVKSPTDEKLRKWLEKRRIPETRDGLDKISRHREDILIPEKNYATLTDHYWIRWRTENWKKVNFFTNRYSLDVGDCFFSPWRTDGRKKINLFSPDLSTRGKIKKRWRQRDDLTSFIVKTGDSRCNQEPLNEVMASVLIECMDKIAGGAYSLYIEGTSMCCASANFVALDSELVTADQLIDAGDDKEISISHLLKCCEEYGIPGAEEYIRWLVFTDMLTGNAPRTLSSFGFLRNVDTMKFIGPAPVYDCSGAFWNGRELNTSFNWEYPDEQKTIFRSLRKEVDIEGVIRTAGIEAMIDSYPDICPGRKKKIKRTLQESVHFLQRL